MQKQDNSFSNIQQATVVRKYSTTQIVTGLVLFSLLFLLLPLKYDNIKAKTFLYPIIWISSAVVVYKMFPVPSRLRTFVFWLGGVVYFFSGLFFYLPNLIGFCASIDRGDLYVNRKDPSCKITMTGYSCFLTDEDIDLHVERSITQHLKWVTSFDEKNVDTTKWERVHRMY